MTNSQPKASTISIVGCRPSATSGLICSPDAHRRRPRARLLPSPRPLHRPLRPSPDKSGLSLKGRGTVASSGTWMSSRPHGTSVPSKTRNPFGLSLVHWSSPGVRNDPRWHRAHGQKTPANAAGVFRGEKNDDRRTRGSVITGPATGSRWRSRRRADRTCKRGRLRRRGRCGRSGWRCCRTRGQGGRN